MADTFTSNLNLTQPEVGSSVDSWGAKLNADLAVIDALFAATGTGTVIARDGSNRALTSGVAVVKAAGNSRSIDFLSTASLRWQLVGANTAAESGSNAGSNFSLNRFADDGTTGLGNPITITRATGLVTFETTPAVGAGLIATRAILDQLVPLGVLLPYTGGVTDPAGGFFLIADGRAISRTTYAALCAAYTAQVGGLALYGAGDGSTTFNIPKMDERTVVGKSAAQALITGYDARVLGAQIGLGQAALTQGQLPNVSFTITGTAADHNHASGAATTKTGSEDRGGGNFQPATNLGTGNIWNGSAGNTGNSGALALTGTAASGGSGTAFNNVQPALVLPYIIRVL